MAAQNFAPALKLVLASEGGNDDDPHDHGGRTSRGITQREYDAYCHIHGLTQGDVWKAPQVTVSAIYHDSYWDPWCDGMPAGVDYAFFDMAVNSGPHEAVVLLQRALGVRDDGHIGVVTQAALMGADAKALIGKFSDQRRAFYRSLHDFKYFGKGWISRTNRVEADADQMVGGHG